MFAAIIAILSCTEIEEMQRKARLEKEKEEYAKRERERVKKFRLRLEKVLEKTGKRMLYKVELRSERDEPDVEYQFYGKLIIAFYTSELPRVERLSFENKKNWRNKNKLVRTGREEIGSYRASIDRIWQLDDGTYLWQTIDDEEYVNKTLLLKYDTFKELEKALWAREVPKHILNKLGIKTKIIIGP